ncbi:hypothetical protein BABINDRAFT_161859 [Babjeviella inositovora NRRL Y-12698]|uniref:calcium/calmodulin-dependent protein kinase n=1 Tax=Babjeviella inositovora NRRL Y-12698 TaxID=984486 RepID=A0A1E3QP43_9ASCO|nr:uncharacterized protein BABINDRAFT_161859 [Babjeviella inositovora NRRL Y-12698]ODQ79463.1 hypothetical protein BABINDRAFT_161859 [Babjeviella inositovora NRRL Y-12698]
MPVVAPHDDTIAPSGKFSQMLNKISGQPESYARKSAYTFGKTLGAGSFGVVRQARNNTTKEEVAIKIMLKSTLNGNEQLVYDELSFLTQLKHPHIVGFRDWFESKSKFYVVTQLATGGELFDRIVDLGHFTERDASLVIYQVAEALEYLHGQNIVHRDVKPENILYLNHEQESPIVLADFGIAKRLRSSDDLIHTSAGSFGYAAPEVLKGLGHGKLCDVWSLGVITYTLLCGYSPFRSENIPDFLAEVKHNNAVIFHEKYWKHISEDARRFIVNLLDVEPTERPSIEQVLQDKWLTNIAAEHHDVDLLPSIRAGFNAKSKFKQAIELVMLQNRIKRLQELDDDDSDDTDFEDVGSSSSTGLSGWGALSSALKKTQSTGSSSSTSSEKKSSDAISALQQLVKTATQNKERVLNHVEE